MVSQIEFVIPTSMAPKKRFCLVFECHDLEEAREIVKYMIPHCHIVKAFEAAITATKSNN